ncbi:diguanylate cyclase [bacterium]|nr:diguanylate cyclase [bacterium]MBU1884234.1 diguanylate cyclase [bacterium]
MAKEKGFYKELGLDVNIREYEFGEDILKKLISSEADFAIADSSVLLYNANRDLDLLFLLAAYQTSPTVLITNEKIKKISDLKTKKIIFNSTEIDNASIDSMLFANGIVESDYKAIGNRFSLNDLTSHKVDAMVAYVSNEPYRLKKRGFKFHVFDPKDYGYKFYDDLLFTSSTYAKKHPKIVDKFYAASMKGWKYAFDHIDETIDVILKKYNTQLKTKEAYRYEANVLKKLAFKEGIKFGDINQKSFTDILKTYDSLGFLDQRFASFKDNIYIPREITDNSFTKLESDYIHDKKRVSLCVNQDQMPFGSVENGSYNGIISDFMSLIKEKTGLDTTFIATKDLNQSLEYVRAKKCSIVPFILKTDDDQKYLNFSAPVLDVRIAVASKSDKSFINDISSLEGKKIGVIKGSGLKSKMKFKYPKVEIQEIDNLQEGLKKVLEDRLYAVMDSTIRLNYLINPHYTGKISIAGQLANSEHLSIGVAKDDFILLSVLDKAVLSIDGKEKASILDRWKRVESNHGLDEDIVKGNIITIVVFFILLMFFIAIRLNIKLKKNIREAQQALMIKTQELSDKNTETEYMLDTIMEGVLIFHDSICINANQSALSISGYSSKADVIGHTFDEFVAEEYREVVQKNMMQNDTEPYEILGVKKDGSTFACLVKGHTFQINAKILRITTFMDLTDSKEKERQLIETQKELQEQAHKDYLTGLYNRRYFAELAQNYMELFHREHKEASMLMIDIDFFKKINDTYGHAEGDKVLKSLAEALLKHTRQSDIVARFGGEEFVILLPNIGVESALHVAQKIRQSVERLDVVSDENELIKFTISIGVSEIHDDDKNIESSIKRADDALYKAKNAGRNRVEIND